MFNLEKLCRGRTNSATSPKDPSVPNPEGFSAPNLITSTFKDFSVANLIISFLMVARFSIDVTRITLTHVELGIGAICAAFYRFNDLVANVFCEVSSAANIAANGNRGTDIPNERSQCYETLYGSEHWLYLLIFWMTFAISFSFKLIPCLWQLRKRKDLFEYESWLDDFNHKVNQEQLEKLLGDALKRRGYKLDEKAERISFELAPDKSSNSTEDEILIDWNIWRILYQKMDHPVLYGIRFSWGLLTSYMTLFWAFYFFTSIAFSSVFLSTGLLWPILLAAAVVLLWYQSFRFLLKKITKNQVGYEERELLLNIKQDILNHLILEKKDAEIKSIFENLMGQRCQLEKAHEKQLLILVEEKENIFQNLQKSESHIVQRLRQPLFVRYFLASVVIEATASVICGATGIWIASIFFNAVGLASVAGIVGGPIGLGVSVLLIASCLLFRHLIKRLSEEQTYTTQLNERLNTKVSELLEDYLLSEIKLSENELKKIKLNESELREGELTESKAYQGILRELKLNELNKNEVYQNVKGLPLEAGLCYLEKLYVTLDQKIESFIQKIDEEINSWPASINQRERKALESLKEKMRECNEQYMQKDFMQLFSCTAPKSKWQRVLGFINGAINFFAGMSMGLFPTRALSLKTGLGLANFFQSFTVLTLLFVSLPFVLILGAARAALSYASKRQEDNQVLLKNLPHEIAGLIFVCKKKSDFLDQLIQYYKHRKGQFFVEESVSEKQDSLTQNPGALVETEKRNLSIPGPSVLVSA
jgi:hypothetical protein